jgi:hypothetical protein
MGNQRRQARRTASRLGSDRRSSAWIQAHLFPTERRSGQKETPTPAIRPNEIGHLLRSTYPPGGPLDLIGCPAVLDRYVAMLEIADLIQPLLECGYNVRSIITRPETQEPNHRHGRLLRAPRQRPRIEKNT